MAYRIAAEAAPTESGAATGVQPASLEYLAIGPESGTIGPEMGPIREATSIGDALFGRVRQRVLSRLFGQPESRFFLNELARDADGAKGAVQRELSRLVASGLVEERVEGRQRYFQAAVRSPVFAELEALVRKSFGTVEALRAALAPLVSEIDAAAVYGSIASGVASARSDVDVLVIGSVSFSALIEALASAHDLLGREINPTLFTPEEWQSRVRAGHVFARDLLSKPLLPILGEIDVLRESGQDRPAPRTDAGSRRSPAPTRGSRSQPARRGPPRAGA